jgi:hypothetical protein
VLAANYFLLAPLTKRKPGQSPHSDRARINECKHHSTGITGKSTRSGPLARRSIAMRRKHFTSRVLLIQKCREYYSPFDLDFSSCPPEQRAALLSYERSRDDNYIRERVAFIRSGTIEGPTYWTPSPGFGWQEWPQNAFLTIDAAVREQRLGLPAPPPDPWIKALPLLHGSALTGKPSTRLVLDVSGDRSREELVAAFGALLDAHGLGVSKPTNIKQGRNTSRDRLEDQMLGLALLRLRRHFSALESIELLENTGWGGRYSEETSLDRHWRKAKRDQCAFSLLAREAMNNGTWFVPFLRT